MLRKLLLKLSKEKFLITVTKISAIVWLACIISFFTIVGYIGFFREELIDQMPDILAFSLLGLILLGCLAFLVGVVSLATILILKNSKKKPNIFIFLFKLFFILAVFPFYLLINIVNPIKVIKNLSRCGFKKLIRSLGLRPILTKILALVLVGVILFPIWIGGYAVIWFTTKEILGYNPKPVPVLGTGSMSPTFPRGKGKNHEELVKEVVATPGMIRYPNGLVIGGRRFFNYEINRGDIVAFENEKIKKMTKKKDGKTSNLLKRVIAIEGDSVELRGGIVYLNDKPLAEPYIAKPRSTFGYSFLGECKKVLVPKNHIFVMGDNRKKSLDSREIGFINLSDVTYVLPLKDQKGELVKYWRDTKNDFDEKSKIKFDKEKYLEILNNKRKQLGSKELIYQPKLELSAKKRAEIIIKFNDFSNEATKSGYPMEKAMRDVSYSNIVWGETLRQGYYEAEELIDNQFQFPESKNFLTDKDYQEIGIAQVEGEINGCPTQVIVQHFAGYVAPNYSEDVIQSWERTLENLKEIQPGWQELKNDILFYSLYKKDIDRINEIINIRIDIASRVITKMRSNQWLSEEEERMIDEEELLYEEQDSLATKLNSRL